MEILGNPHNLHLLSEITRGTDSISPSEIMARICGTSVSRPSFSARPALIAGHLQDKIRKKSEDGMPLAVSHVSQPINP